MNISDLLITMAQTAEVEQPTLFPFPFSMHIAFCIISVVFFVCRFAKTKLPYQIIMSVAIPVSLLIWVSNSRTLFYGVGIAEAVMLAVAFATTFLFRKKQPKAESAEESADKEQEE